MLDHVGVDDPVQKAVSHAPLLLPALQSDGLVVQANDPAATLLLVAIDKSHHVADGDFIASQTLWLLFPNFNIRTIEVEGDIGNEPAPAIISIQDDCLLAPHFKYLPAPQRVGLRIEILDRLTDL